MRDAFRKSTGCYLSRVTSVLQFCPVKLLKGAVLSAVNDGGLLERIDLVLDFHQSDA